MERIDVESLPYKESFTCVNAVLTTSYMLAGYFAWCQVEHIIYLTHEIQIKYVAVEGLT